MVRLNHRLNQRVGSWDRRSWVRIFMRHRVYLKQNVAQPHLHLSCYASSNTSRPPGLPVPHPHRPYPLHSSCNSSQLHPSGSPGPLISHPLSSLPRLGSLPTPSFPLAAKHTKANSSFEDFCSAKETYLFSSESSFYSFFGLSRLWHKLSEMRHPGPLAKKSCLPGHFHGPGSDQLLFGIGHLISMQVNWCPGEINSNLETIGVRVKLVSISSQYLKIPRRFSIDSRRFSISPDSDLQIPISRFLADSESRWSESKGPRAGLDMQTWASTCKMPPWKKWLRC